MVDAVLFMAIMLVASSLILGSTAYREEADTVSSAMGQYADDFRMTLMCVELRNGNGSCKPVSQILCDEFMAIWHGACASQYEYDNMNILAAGRNLIRPGLEFAISCGNGTVFLSGGVYDAGSLPDNVWASCTAVRTAGCPGDIAITVWVWVI